ncbi:MAG: hypothetical protein ACFFD8_03405 [Candidatus Thorarchaeota archaeon]
MEKNTISKVLVILGGILQLIYLLANAFFGFILFILLLLGAIFTPGDPLLTLAAMTTVSMLISAFLGFILMILWFVWASNPSTRRKVLIVTGILGILLGGIIPALLAYSTFGTTWPSTWLTLIITSFLPGFLVLIGGLIASKPLEA